MFVYVIVSKVMLSETVNVVRDKLGLSRGSVTFPTFGGDIVVVAGLTERVGPQNTSGARWAHPC